LTLAKARVVNYDRNSSFIVLATVIMIVNYNRKTFIVQATGHSILNLLASVIYGCLQEAIFAMNF
jgi:hypothetical protein